MFETSHGTMDVADVKLGLLDARRIWIHVRAHGIRRRNLRAFAKTQEELLRLLIAITL